MSACNFLLDHLTLARCILPDRHYGPCSASPLFLAEYVKSERLIDAAPDMARVLLAVEWSAGDGGCECPSCGEYRGQTETHATDCALDAALRKAGIHE